MLPSIVISTLIASMEACCIPTCATEANAKPNMARVVKTASPTVHPSIHQRPAIVEQKERIGDFEIDTIIGKGRRSAIVTMVDRTSLYLKLSLPVSKKAHIIAHEAIRKRAPFRRHLHTITSDNGLEFAQHQSISKKLGCDYYFCDPYSSWQRGINENINGLIRQYIPKGSSFEHLNKRDIQRIEEKLNHRPRKSLGWKTPYEVFHEKMKAS